jgi:hypothetical protein
MRYWLCFIPYRSHIIYKLKTNFIFTFVFNNSFGSAVASCYGSNNVIFSPHTFTISNFVDWKERTKTCALVHVQFACQYFVCGSVTRRIRNFLVAYVSLAATMSCYRNKNFGSGSGKKVAASPLPNHRYLISRLSLQVVYLWRHVSSTAPPFILWWSNLEILFGPLHRSSLFIGELRCQAIQMEHGPYIAERTQKAIYIVRYLCPQHGRLVQLEILTGLKSFRSWKVPRFPESFL